MPFAGFIDWKISDKMQKKTEPPGHTSKKQKECADDEKNALFFAGSPGRRLDRRM